jgi:hypothetical protein
MMEITTSNSINVKPVRRFTAFCKFEFMVIPAARKKLREKNVSPGPGPHPDSDPICFIVPAVGSNVSFEIRLAAKNCCFQGTGEKAVDTGRLQMAD